MCDIPQQIQYLNFRKIMSITLIINWKCFEVLKKYMMLSSINASRHPCSSKHTRASVNCWQLKWNTLLPTYLLTYLNSNWSLLGCDAVTTQKTSYWIFTIVKTSNLALLEFISYLEMQWKNQHGEEEMNGGPSQVCLGYWWWPKKLGI